MIDNPLSTQPAPVYFSQSDFTPEGWDVSSFLWALSNLIIAISDRHYFCWAPENLLSSKAGCITIRISGHYLFLKCLTCKAAPYMYSMTHIVASRALKASTLGATAPLLCFYDIPTFQSGPPSLIYFWEFNLASNMNELQDAECRCHVSRDPRYFIHVHMYETST